MARLLSATAMQCKAAGWCAIGERNVYLPVMMSAACSSRMGQPGQQHTDPAGRALLILGCATCAYMKHSSCHQLPLHFWA